MKIGIGSDHTGHGSKNRLARLTALGHETACIEPHAYRADAGYSPHVVEAARRASADQSARTTLTTDFSGGLDR